MSAEPRKSRRWKFVLLGLLGVIILGGAAAWMKRTTIQAAYYAYRLRHAPEGERQRWAERLVELGEVGAPKLLECWRSDNVATCDVARAALEQLLATWGSKDPRSLALADRFFEMHPTFSPAGQIAALQLLPEVLAVGSVETNARARTLVSAALKDRKPELRLLGVAVAMRNDLNLLSAVVPLLNDPEPRIRRAALLAVGPTRDTTESPVINSDELLHWLHDPDYEVRQVCEMALKSRGLRDTDVRLGRMLTHPEPQERLQLLLRLPQEENLDLTVWMHRLSNDSESAVRAGAARLAAEMRLDFADRLREMSTSDPDTTVRKLAAYYERAYSERP